jgi:Flp pilus assembly protein TadD
VNHTPLLLALWITIGACQDGEEAFVGASPAAKQALGRARLLYAEEKPFDAIAEVQKAIELAPGWAEAHLSLGKLLLTYSDVRFSTATIDRGRLEEAIQHLERAYLLEPKDPETSYWSGAALAKADRLPEARKRLETSLELRPSHGPTLQQLGSVLAIEGETKRAIEILARAREASPKDAEVALQLGLQLESEGRLEEARDAFLAACDLNRAHPGPRSALVVLYGRLGEPEQAEFMRTEFERCRAFGKRLTAAAQYFDAHSREPAACMGLAELYMEIGNADEAASWAGRAVRLDPQHGPGLELLNKLGRPSKVGGS